MIKQILNYLKSDKVLKSLSDVDCKYNNFYLNYFFLFSNIYQQLDKYIFIIMVNTSMKNIL